jgi:hypothetical protein
MMIRKRLRGGYNRDAGTEAGWVHKDVITPSVASRLNNLEVDSDLEILPALTVKESSVICLTSFDD